MQENDWVSQYWPLGPTSPNLKQNHLLLDCYENSPKIKSVTFSLICIKLQFENTAIDLSEWHQISPFSAAESISNKTKQIFLNPQL